jgi:polyisoprenoid-binding protein YceI
VATDVTHDRLAGDWRFNSLHSSATFAVKYMVAAFRGTFPELDAQLVDGKLSGSAKAASLKVKDPGMNAHLQSAEFFDAENQPDITFASTSIAIDGDHVELDGELTIKGITNPLHATGTIAGPAVDFAGSTRLGFTLEATIDRSQFEMNWNADLPSGGKALSNEVTLTAELEFHKA